jgi:hypothetical protein
VLTRLSSATSTISAPAISAPTSLTPPAADIHALADRFSAQGLPLLTEGASVPLDAQQSAAHRAVLRQWLISSGDGSEASMRALLHQLRTDGQTQTSLRHIAGELYARERAAQALPALIGRDIYYQFSPEQIGALQSALAERLLNRTDGTAQGMSRYLETLSRQRRVGLDLLEESGAFSQTESPTQPRSISLFGDPDFRLQSLRDAFGYMGNRVTGSVDRSMYPQYQAGMENAGRSVPVQLRELTYLTPREDQPVLNWINQHVLRNPALLTLLRNRGIRELQLTEMGLRVGTTFPFDQRRQFVEIDDLVRVVRTGIADIATEIYQRDWAGVQAAWTRMMAQLNAASDQAFRPNRGTMSEGVQAPALDQGAILGASTVAGLPGEVARSLFIEMSAKNNVESEGGTGGIVLDARSPSGYRLNVAYDNGQYVVLRPIVMKSILQTEVLGQAAPILPLTGGNLPIQSLLNPLQVPWVGFLPTVEVRSMNYVGENAGYWVIPAGARLTERQVALLNEGIADPALFSEAGNAANDWRLLFRGFESDSMLGMNVRNREDNMRTMTPERGGQNAYQLRGDVEVGLGLTVSPLIGTPLAPFSKYFGVTPFRMGGGAVFKATVFPEPPGVGRLITMSQDGGITEQTLRSTAFEARANGITMIRVPPELQDPEHAAALNTVFVALPSQAALIFAPNTGFSAETVIPRWGRHSQQAVSAYINAMTQSTNNDVRSAALNAARVFERHPAVHGSRFLMEQRDALLRVVLAEVHRIQSEPIDRNRPTPPQVRPPQEGVNVQETNNDTDI